MLDNSWLNRFESERSEIVRRLRLYAESLEKWRRVTNLMSHKAFADLWTRHIPDGISVQRAYPEAVNWLDFGSGAGIPAIVIAIVIANRPDAIVTCIEADGRKCAFIRDVALRAQIPLRVLQGRIELKSPADIGRVEAVTARAFSTVGKILELADPYLCQGAVAILPRGRAFAAEISEVSPLDYRIEVKPNEIYNAGAVAVIHKRLEAAK